MKEYTLILRVRVPDDVRPDEIATLLEDDLRSQLDTIYSTLEDFQITPVPPEPRQGD